MSDSSCSQTIDYVFAYLDATLPASEQGLFIEHIHVCTRCATYVRHARALLECISTRDRIQCAPPKLRRRILDALVELDDSDEC
jgi:hypothetical protein